MKSVPLHIYMCVLCVCELTINIFLFIKTRYLQLSIYDTDIYIFTYLYKLHVTDINITNHCEEITKSVQHPTYTDVFGAFVAMRLKLKI